MRYVFGIFVVFALLALGQDLVDVKRSLDIIDGKLNKIEFDNAQDRAARLRMEYSW